MDSSERSELAVACAFLIEGKTLPDQPTKVQTASYRLEKYNLARPNGLGFWHLTLKGWRWRHEAERAT